MKTSWTDSRNNIESSLPSLLNSMIWKHQCQKMKLWMMNYCLSMMMTNNSQTSLMRLISCHQRHSLMLIKETMKSMINLKRSNSLLRLNKSLLHNFQLHKLKRISYQQIAVLLKKIWQLIMERINLMSSVWTKSILNKETMILFHT